VGHPCDYHNDIILTEYNTGCCLSIAMNCNQKNGILSFKGYLLHRRGTTCIVWFV